MADGLRKVYERAQAAAEYQLSFYRLMSARKNGAR